MAARVKRQRLSQALNVELDVTCLLDLDDSCLRVVFQHLNPLPDLFNVAQACWRFRRITSDKHRWLVVAAASTKGGVTPSGNTPGANTPGARVYITLKAAVLASRPGDTLWLSPGEHEAQELPITWPLQLIGGGKRPEDTLIVSPKGSESALDISATARLAHLAISSSLGPCLVHRKGALTVEGCLLRTDAQGLGHLVSPLVTRARGPGSSMQEVEGRSQRSSLGVVGGNTCGEQAPAGALPVETAVHLGAAGGSQGQAVDIKQKRKQVAEAAWGFGDTVGFSNRSNPAGAAAVGRFVGPSMTPPPRLPPVAAAGAARAALAAVGPGRLSVIESRLLGGCTAVRCEGTGQVRSVRVIYEAHATLFYLEVDSSDLQGWKGVPAGLVGLGQQQQQRALRHEQSMEKQQQQQIACDAALVRVDPLQADTDPSPSLTPCIEKSQPPSVRLGRAAVEGMVGGARGARPQLSAMGPAGAAAGLRKIQNLLGQINPGMLGEHLRDKSRA